jgi:ABC-type Mn2+/Zn2+ transport system ATPase subunit
MEDTAMRRGSAIINLEDVSTVYEGERRSAIRNVNLSIDQNELVYVVGPNASGKTTLLETINGLLPTFQGTISVLGLNVQTRGRRVRCEIGYVPQDFMVEPGEPYSALDIVMMGRYGKIGVLHRPNETDQEETMKTMRLLDIEELAHRPMGKLSGGQQQKVMIARALAKEPKILLLDEPFSNLDPTSRKRVPALIQRLHEEKGWITLIVTHDIHSMLKTCRRVVMMNNGRIVVDETPEQALRIWEARP